MALATGSRLGPYEVVAPLGAGGMGEVYRARDTRLDRTVAIKVLAPDLASDSAFRQRFHAEARAISQLTHPHICTLHDIGEHAGTTFLVMELLTGETLADRLARGTPAQPALTLEQAVQIGIQIAEALAAAHAHGIVHRDLKPGNIMLTKGAASSAVQAKLLDFGLAKAAPVVTGTGVTMAPTTPPQAATARGSIVGTIQYMAPEQVEGGAVDARTDIFALGGVLYELLTGRKAFEGKSQAHVMAAILEREPPAVSALQPRVPALVEATITKCLAKHPDDRWQSAADLATALRWATGGPGATALEAASLAAPVDSRTSPMRLAGLILLAAALGAAVTAVVARNLRDEVPPLRTMRFEIQPPGNAHWSPAPISSTAQMALAPNGEHLAFVAAAKGATSRIWIRALRAVEARELPDTDSATFPFWSPDSRSVAFFADGKLKKVDVSGGRPQVLANAPTGRGGTWGPTGIVFTPAPSQGLFQVSAEGGAVTELTSAERMRGVTHYWPQFLPDGQRLLFYQRSGEPGSQGIYVVDVRSKAARRVMLHDGRAIYAAGHFLTVRDGMLFSQRVDEESLAPLGEPVRIADQVGYFGGTFGDASVTVANDGTLAYGPRIVMVTSLQWRDRGGGVITQVTTPGAAYRSPLLAPDEKMVVFSLLDPGRNEGPDIWMAELGRGRILTRLTTDPRNDWFPVWSSDGSHLFFGSTRRGSTGLFRKTPSGSAPDEPLTEPTQFGRYPTDVTRDGTTLVYHEVAQQGYDLGLIETTGAGTARKVLATQFNEVQGRLSPDQRWVAYASDESGRFEVYVRPFPDGSSQTTVSIAGGMQPRWRGDGKELFYLAPNGQLMAVAVTTGPAFTRGEPQALFRFEVPEPSAPFPTDYDVSADGRRFLVNTVVEQAVRPSVTVILNWTADLARR